MKHLLWIVPVAFALCFGVNILLTKGIIWIAAGLFNVDWSDKFWMVFVLLFIVQSVVGCAKGPSSIK